MHNGRKELNADILAYLTSGQLDDSDKSSPLFRTTIRRTKQLTENWMTADDIGRMVKRRLRAAGLPSRLSPHSFRVTTITDLLSQAVPLEDVQNLAGHADHGPLGCTIGGSGKSLAISSSGFRSSGCTLNFSFFAYSGHRMNLHRIWIEQCEAARGGVIQLLIGQVSFPIR
jgi:hypothetical protein